MKLSPLFIFLLLLVVLVISITTLKNPIIPIDKEEKEGFIQFHATTAAQKEVQVPQYSSRPIVKLYDNLFIDRKNANIVEVVSSEFTGNLIASPVSGNVDLTGASITAINVQNRDGVFSNYPVSSIDVVERADSKISSITSSYNTIPYYTTIGKTTGTYQLFYIPWNTDTYIHAIQLKATPREYTASFIPSHLFTYYIPSTSTENIKVSMYSNKPLSLVKPTTTDTNANNNKMVSEPLYSISNKVYQLSSDIKFDIKNANLIVNTTGGINVYDRSGVSKTYTSPPNNLRDKIATDVQFGPWIISDEAKTTQVLYVQNIENTLVALFQTDESNRYKMINIARFNKNGLDSGESITQKPPKDVPAVNPSALSEYYKWYWYWNSSTGGIHTNSQYSNDYMLKTQIVPPVCPSCPSATCNGGSGPGSGSSGNIVSDTVDTTGNVVNKTVDTTGNVVNKTVDTAGSVVNRTVDTAGSVVNKTIDTTSKLLTSGATGATNLLTSGATGATNLLTSGVSGATDLAKSGVSGTVGLIKDAGSGTVGLLKDAGSGAIGVVDKTLDTTGNVLNNLSNPENGYGSAQGVGYKQGGYGYSGAPGFSKGNPPIDNYSYYGALPNKGSSYIPITADFSAFKK